MRISYHNNRGRWWTSALACFLFVGSAELGAKESGAAPEIWILDPMDTAPMPGSGSRDAQSGLSQHRRVVSKPKQGSVHLDVGYNIYKTGAGSDIPYAYDKDEICYFPSGNGRFRSDGVDVLTRPGILMWRPARAATQSGRALSDMVTICAFAPARDDDWSHKLPASEIGKWDGDPNRKPKVRWFHNDEATIVAHPSDPDHRSGRIVERMLLPAQADGVKGADVTLTQFKSGLALPARTSEREQICWLESGSLTVKASGQPRRLKPSDFLYSPAGSRIEGIEVLEDSSLLCFTEPARTGK